MSRPFNNFCSLGAPSKGHFHTPLKVLLGSNYQKKKYLSVKFDKQFFISILWQCVKCQMKNGLLSVVKGKKCFASILFYLFLTFLGTMSPLTPPKQHHLCWNHLLQYFLTSLLWFHRPKTMTKLLETHHFS